MIRNIKNLGNICCFSGLSFDFLINYIVFNDYHVLDLVTFIYLY